MNSLTLTHIGLLTPLETRQASLSQERAIKGSSSLLQRHLTHLTTIL